MFFDVDWGVLGRTALIILAVFMIVGGIVSQTAHGASGKGFMEGMGKGFEWFAIAAIGFVIIMAVIWGMGGISNALHAQ